MQELSPEYFSPTLDHIPHPPPRLYALGDPSVLKQGNWVALVGTRRPSPYGLKAAHAFSRRLLELGFHLVSGLARGIDAVAHRASLLVRRPTVAVLGHGLDRIYPAEHRRLAAEILEGGGCLLSEHPPGVTPRPHYFPSRNRIISGLARGVVVVEAGMKSGSLTTARHAADQSRDVFIVPGPFDAVGFAGSHWLIQQGAMLVTAPDEIAHVLAPECVPREAVAPLTESNAVAQLIQEHGVIGLDELVVRSKRPLHEIHEAIETLREAGRIVEIGPQTFVYAGR